MQDSASVGVIGGSGFYELLENAREVRIDTPQEIEYFEHGGILQYVLRQLAAK